MVTRQSRRQDDLASEPRSVELRDYALIVRRRWVTVLVAMVLGAALAAAYAVHKGAEYAATSQVVVEPVTQGPLNPSAQPNLQVNMATEQAVAQSAPVAQLAAGLMHSKLSAASAQAAIASHLSVTVPLLSDVLQITWQARTAKAAQAGANAFANAYLTYRHDLLSSEITRLGNTLSQQATALQHQIKSVSAQLGNSPSSSPQHQNLQAQLDQLNGQLTKASDTLASLPTYDVSGGNVIGAALPLKPTGLRRSLILILGALIGLLAGIVAAFVRDALDDRLRDPAALERKLGAPTLAILPASRKPRSAGAVPAGRGAPVASMARRESRAADSFRALRTMLTSVTAGKGLSSLVVVGVDGSVSSSQVAAELGVALAESGRQTLLIAADIRGSALPQIFDVPNAEGLTNVLVGKADPAPLVQRPNSAGGVALPPDVVRKLSLLPNGLPLAQPLSMLDSVAMARFLKSLRADYDFIVLDSPPPPATDVLALARLVDGVLAVASEIRTKGRSAEDLRQRLDRISGYLVGGIFVTKSRSRGHRRAQDRLDTEAARGSIVARPPESKPANRTELAKAADPPAQPTPADTEDAPASSEPQRVTRRPS